MVHDIMPPLPRLAAELKLARRIKMGLEIRLKRKSANLTQADVANVLHWSRTTLLAIENGTQATTIDQLYELADLLDYDIRDFLCYDGRFAAQIAKDLASGVKPIITSEGTWVIDREVSPPPAIAEAAAKKSPPRPSPAMTRAKTKKPAKKKVRRVKSK